jgi:uncharacterized membrane protein
MEPRQLLVVLFIGTGLLMAGLAVPMILRIIPPNPFYGFRLPKTMKNPEIWYEINAYSGRWLFAVGLGVALSAAALYVLFPGLDKDLFASAVGIVVLILVTIMMIASLNRLRRM